MRPALVPPSRTPQLVAALDEVERIARELTAGEVETLLGRGAKLDGLLTARLAALAAASAAPVASPDAPLLLDDEAAARLLGVSRSTLYRRVKAGKLPVCRPSDGVRRFRRTDVEAYISALS